MIKVSKILKELNWKYILIFALVGVILQDIIIEKVVLWIFYNSVISWDYVVNMRAVQAFIYFILSFVMCGLVKKYRFLHIILLVVLATLLSSLIQFFIFLIKSQLLFQSFIFSVSNLTMIISLLYHGVIGFLAAKLYFRYVTKKSNTLTKLSFPIATLIGLITVLFIQSFGGISPMNVNLVFSVAAASFSGIPVLFVIILGSLSYGVFPLASLMPFLGIHSFSATIFERPWYHLWYLIIYYTLFFFWLGFCQMKYKKTHKIRWMVFLILPIVIHLVSAFFSFGMILLGIGLG